MRGTKFTGLLYLATFTLAQNLTFVRPHFDDLETNDEGIPQLTTGESVTIEWESDFQYTTLVVYQEIGSGSFDNETLAQGVRHDRTEATWEVGSLPGSESLDGPFHFELRNGVDRDCDGCSVNSEDFVVVSRREATSSTATPTATAAAGGATQSRGSTASATPIPTTSAKSSTHLGVGLGIGLGLGIPIVLTILFAMFCMRRRRTRRKSLPRGRQPSSAHNPDRASGAWLYRDGRQSQQSMLFRHSTATPSEVSSWSPRWWIQPFEFEQMEMRDQDAISQLRQSLYSTAPTRRSEVSSLNAGAEWGMLEGIPEQPRAAHDGRWSRTL